MAVSQSGYEMLDDYGDPALIKNPNVPGSDTKILGGILNGAPATVLLYVAKRWNIEVEPLLQTHGVWGFDPQHNATTTTSNHKSGTAMDLNAADHPQHIRGTFGPHQVSAIRSILAYCDGVVGWGGDFSGRSVDEMHVELAWGVANTGRVEKLAAKIIGTKPDPPDPKPEPPQQDWDEMATKEEIAAVFHAELAQFFGTALKDETPKLRVGVIGKDGNEVAKAATIVEALTATTTYSTRALTQGPDKTWKERIVGPGTGANGLPADEVLRRIGRATKALPDK